MVSLVIMLFLRKALTINEINKITRNTHVIAAPRCFVNIGSGKSCKKPIRLMIIPPIITPLNLLLTRSAIDAGSTITADTRRDPAIGIITAITTPVIIVKRFVIKRTGNPAVIAVSSSNDNTYSGLRKITYNPTTTTASRIIIHICSFVIVTIEPNKNWSTLNVERPFAYSSR